MTIYEAVENLCTWLNDNVCSDATFLKVNNDQNTTNYDPEYIHPYAFPLYIPTSERRPPEAEATSPSICVQLLGGETDLKTDKTSIDLRLAFSVWRYGSYVEKEDAEGNKSVTFTRNMEGWKDVFIFLERTKYEICKNMYIEGLKVDRAKPMEFGLFSEDEAFPDYYPFWYTYLTCRVICGAYTANPGYDDIL